MRLLRRLLVGAAVTLLFLAAASSAPAGAVSQGTQDTTGRYPYVGTLVLRLGEPGAYTYHYWCSGTLVARSAAAPRTATGLVANGHCFDNAFQQLLFPGSTLVGMTLDPVVGTTAPPSTILTGVGHVDPGYPRATDDVGVFRLNQPISLAVDLPRLPVAGELSTMDEAGTLVGTDATIVGYGVDRTPTGGATGILWNDNGIRRYATERVTTLSAYWLHLQSISAQGDSGPCSGDSGAPRLLQQDSLLAAITGGVGGQCQAPERALRLDRADVLDFVQQYTG